MLIVTNLKGESLPLMNYKPPVRTRNIDGTHTLSVVIKKTARNAKAFDLINYEGKLHLDNNTYRIKKMKRDIAGNVPQLDITALHVFFDIIHDYQYDVIPGEKVLTLHQGLEHALAGTGITFIIEDEFDSISFENFGDANCLNLFEKLRTSFGFEFIIENDNFLRIRKQIGRVTNEQLRWKHNIKHISEDIDTTNLTTYIRGVGKRDDDGNPLIEVEYTSPNADKYEKLYHADPVEDERFTKADSFTRYLKSKIVDKPEISYTIEYSELRKAGAESLELGDSAFLIHEILQLDFLTRVVEVIDYPTLPSKKPIYTISSKKQVMTDKQVQNNMDKQSMKDDIKWTKKKQNAFDKKMEKVQENVADVENAMVDVQKEMDRIDNDVIPEIEQAVKDSYIPRQSNEPDHNEYDLWWDTSQNPPRFMRWNGSDWVQVAPTDADVDKLIEDAKKDVTVEYKQYTQEEIEAAEASILNKLDTEIGDVGSRIDDIRDKTAGIEGTVNNITQVVDDIDGKLSTTIEQLSNMDGIVSENKLQIEANAEGLKAKAEKTEVYTKTQTDTKLGNKVDSSVYKNDMSELDIAIGGISGRVSNTEAIIDDLSGEMSNARSQIASLDIKAGKIEQSVSDVRADFDNMQIGGRNLLRFTDFSKEANTDQWTDIGAVKFIRPRLFEGFPRYFGYSSVETSPVGYRVRIRTPYNVSFVKDQTYTLSWIGLSSDWVDTDFAYTGILKPNGYFVDNKSLPTAKRKKVGEVDAFGYNKAVYKYTITFTFVADTANNYSIMFGSTVNKESAPWMAIADVMLEHGTLAGDWDISPEDTDARITEAEGSITTLAGEVELKASKTSVDSVAGRMTKAEGRIDLLSDEVDISVKRDDVIARINATPEKITIGAARVDIKGLVSFINNDNTTGTLIDGGRLINSSVTTKELDVNQVFANSAVIAKIRSDIVLTTELNANKIVTGELNAAKVAIVNLSASDIKAGVLDALKVRIKNLNASEINSGVLSAIEINGVTITASLLKAGNNKTNFDLKTGTLHMSSADITLGGGANIKFTDSGNRIVYGVQSSLDNAYRYAGVGVGRSINDNFPFAFLGTTYRAGGSLNPKDEDYFTGFITNTNARMNEDDIGNSVVGDIFHVRDQSVDFNKGFIFNLRGNTVTMYGMNTSSYTYQLGTDNNSIERAYINTLRINSGVYKVQNQFDILQGWKFETSYSGESHMSLFGINAGNYWDKPKYYNLGKSKNRFSYLYLYYQPDVSSDEKLKKNIKDNTLGLNFINEIETKSFNLKSERSNEPTQYGVIAQNLLGSLIKHGVDTKSINMLSKGEDGMYGVQYTQLIAPTIKAVQEVDAKFTKVTKCIRNRVDKLELENQYLKQKVKLLEEKIA